MYFIAVISHCPNFLLIIEHYGIGGNVLSTEQLVINGGGGERLKKLQFRLSKVMWGHLRGIMWCLNLFLKLEKNV